MKPLSLCTNLAPDADCYVQKGYLYEFDTLKLASEGKLLTCFGNNAGSTYLILNMPPAPDQDAAPGNQERGWDPEMDSAYDDPDDYFQAEAETETEDEAEVVTAAETETEELLAA